jgi:pimeloyl-ACP methyl ester carboxylesterase
MIRSLARSLLLPILMIASATSAGGQDSSLVAWLIRAADNASTPKPTIVLVHGASESAASWEYVVPILKKDGYKVIAVENPLSSLGEDIATTRKVIRAQQNPVVVVGHSYGGAVITGAAAGSLNVKALVYLAASAPDADEPVLGETISFPAWRTIRSWYLVSQDDRAIKPDLQRFYAKRMRATTSEVRASQAAFTSQPSTVAQFIEQAAVATRK